MKTRLRHILLAGLAALLLTACGSRVIPRDKLAHIYAEMLLADQWIKNDRKLTRQADTSLVYEAIFEKYGYTTEDYRKSVEQYMQDPERFSRIFEQTEEILNQRIDGINREERLQKTLDSLRRVKRDRWYPKPELLHKQALPYLSDSLSITLDSAGGIHLQYATADTMYLGPGMVISDSLLRRDSIYTALRDSLLGAKVDSARLNVLLDSLMALRERRDTVAVEADSLAQAQPDTLRSSRPLKARTIAE